MVKICGSSKLTKIGLQKCCKNCKSSCSHFLLFNKYMKLIMVNIVVNNVVLVKNNKHPQDVYCLETGRCRVMKLGKLIETYKSDDAYT